MRVVERLKKTTTMNKRMKKNCQTAFPFQRTLVSNQPRLHRYPHMTPTGRCNPQPNTPTSTSRSSAPNTSSHKRGRSVSPQAGPSKSLKRKKKKISDREYGVTRGVDFVDVACVVNFDLPLSSGSYTHRVGRTARAGRTGMSLSFVVPTEEWGKDKTVGCLESSKNDEVVFAKIEKKQVGSGNVIKEYRFDMQQVEAFRYRMEDALRSVTRGIIKEARIKELKTEILNSERLKVRASVLRSCLSIANGCRHTLRTTH